MHWTNKYPQTARDDTYYKTVIDSLNQKIAFEVKNRDFAEANMKEYNQEIMDLQTQRIEYLKEKNDREANPKNYEQEK